MLLNVSLEDKFERRDGRALISGTQALTRILIDQRRADMRQGLNSAGFVSGYRGSPLGHLDAALWSARAQLDRHGIVFRPGVNEELAATAVYGTQQLGFFPSARHDGVFAAWYGKGPGVDRAGDSLKHGNLAGTSATGGVLVLAGDDHSAKSSTTAHQSEQALMAALVPVLYPASVAEYLEFGAFGYALSRFSGLWAGFKCVNDTADATATVDLCDRSWVVPVDVELPPEGLNILKGESQLGMERRTIDFRLPAAQAFVRANRMDRVLRDGRRRSLGIVTAGKAALDLLQALEALGLDEARCAELGIRVLKLAMTWPVEPSRVRDFATGHRQLLIVEEKRAFIEPQLASILYQEPADRRPPLVGKADAEGRPLLPQTNELTPPVIEAALMRVLEALELADDGLRARWAERRHALERPAVPATAFARMPFFCSGCPHNSSTRVPDGSIAFSGIGCHVMAALMPHRQHLWPVQMGGEGANWIGLAPFVDERHVFQNLGDGTYYHSGLLAIRAAVTAGVNITYKLLYNDAVAMTGGQPVEGQLTPWAIATELLQEGVRKVVVVADDPGRYPEGTSWPTGVTVHGRDALERVQRELRETSGVTLLIYDQVCAAEKRRRSKRAERPPAVTRAFINDLVCEGCGDCSAKSNCVSIQPLETEFGRKRQVDQSSCNTDLSCVEGFCPSFVTVRGGGPKARAVGARVDADALAVGPPPPPAEGAKAILILGIGGTGVVTVGAVLAMAAHLEGKAASVVDQTGLSQKNGAVSSHLRIAEDASQIAAARIHRGEADVLLGCDLLTAGGAEAMSLVRPGETSGVLNCDLTATAAFTINNAVEFQALSTVERLRTVLAGGRSAFVDATQVTAALLGDTIGTNMFVVGAALQKGLLPVSLEAVEQAIRLNGVAVDFNLLALRLGRYAAADPAGLAALVARHRGRAEGSRHVSASLEELIARRRACLADYQDERYARRYAAAVRRAREREAALPDSTGAFAETVARNLFKLMAYKDEYEVARLHTSAEFEARLRSQFGEGYRLSFHLAPPLLARRDPLTGEPRKRAFGPWMLRVLRLLARLKRLRGTPFDPFGHTAERRTERRLIRDYETLVERVSAQLTPANHALAVELAAYPDAIRGFGPIKARNLEAAEARRDALLERFAAASAALPEVEAAA